eukprot:TRINITY_DN714_c0_g2_i13.p1 TRINITY_DN714_c0_g2~~TRINITY_DN714_c0_g2_i13.p1  ORF type:complete len:744 (+),score=41.11 TRINITY_DN714_c0_g2_i13:1344-3575(+)
MALHFLSSCMAFGMLCQAVADAGHCASGSCAAPDGAVGLQLLQVDLDLQHLGRDVPHAADDGSEAVLGSVEMSAAKDGKSATVHFDHGGKSYDYNLKSFSAFSKASKLLEHTEAGEMPMQMNRGRLFKSWVPGRRATATLDKDGVSGLFEVDGRILEVRSGQISLVNSRVIWKAKVPVLSSDTALLQQNATKPEVIVEYEQLEEGVSNVAPMEDEDGDWGGEQWWPGCFSGDSEMHEFHVGFVVDYPGWARFGDEVVNILERMVAEASFVYEHQMHIKIKIGHLKIFKTTQGVDDIMASCPETRRDGDMLGEKLGWVSRNYAREYIDGATHAMTACGAMYGTLGLAYVGSACTIWNTGVNKLHLHPAKLWRVFAHELGHNLGAGHSFEEGRSMTGGLMDYGNGKLNGHYQFNTKYRKTEICTKLNKFVDNCQGGSFVVEGSGPEPSKPACQGDADLFQCDHLYGPTDPLHYRCHVDTKGGFLAKDVCSGCGDCSDKESDTTTTAGGGTSVASTATTTQSTTSSTIAPVTTATTTAPRICRKQWQQCGGVGWAGETCCVAGTYCDKSSRWYQSCKQGGPDSAPTPSPPPATTSVTTTTASRSTTTTTATTATTTTTTTTTTSTTSTTTTTTTTTTTSTTSTTTTTTTTSTTSTTTTTTTTTTSTTTTTTTSTSTTTTIATTTPAITITTTTTATTTTTTTTTTLSAEKCQRRWQQCGGKGWSGATCCEAGSECVAQGPWYSQCK